MNWKAFIAVSVSSFLISFPQNIIGCGDGMDPYDYYTSFMHPTLTDLDGYKPFYYTSYSFLYEEAEPANPAELLAKEWAAYCGSPVTATDAYQFVNYYDRKDINNLYVSIEKKDARKVTDSVTRNSMGAWFLKSKDLEALGYILYAKQVEPYVQGAADAWEPVTRDTAKMSRLQKNGLQLLTAAKTDFFKLKYAYQVERLAHYSSHYNEAIQAYDDHIAANPSNSILQPMSLALKAGALFRTGRDKEAAYLFSKSFSSSVAKRVSNYLGFKWSVDSKINRREYLAMCKTDKEKADMLGLFAMGSTANEVNTMKSIYQVDANNEVLKMLAIREINKLEENYFTPMLQKQKNHKSFYYYYWQPENKDSMLNASGKQGKALADFLHTAANNSKVTNAGLYEIAAAYTAYMMNDLPTAKKYLASAKQMTLSGKLKDQWMLTNILVTINENEKIDAAFEAQLLPSLQWLQAKVKSEPVTGTQYYPVTPWRKVYRDLLNEILASRYHKQGDLYKETLCIGAADAVAFPENDFGYGRGIEFMRNNLGSKEVEQLYGLLTSKNLSAFDQELIRKNSITQSLVTDYAGTAYLREYNYSNAIKWFKNTSEKKRLDLITNPFADLLYDQEEQLASETNFKTNKLAFAETMLKLQGLSTTDKVNEAKHLYKIATALYNMTYYGHAWQLVQYERSGSDGYFIPKNATAFQKEYYGCYSALSYFEKAMHASTDNNFKARCLFMMAKCSQKQVQKPSYADFNYNWDKLDAAEKAYWPKFKNNQYFPELEKTYRTTPFYQEAFNSCSYLRDFVQRK